MSMKEGSGSQLKGLMKEEDFVAAQPFLLGEDFGSVAIGKLHESCCYPEENYYLQSSKGKQGIQGGYPHKFSSQGNINRGSRQPSYGPGKSKKGSQTKVKND